MRYDRNEIISRFNSKGAKFLLFWGHTPSGGAVGKECLSQWYDCLFEIEGVRYRTAEQYMMSQKALLFGDREINERIMKAPDPKAFKQLGKKVRGFDDNMWKKERCNIVVRGNYAKFSQNEPLKEFLLGTGENILVEASPYDKIWGIGLSANNKKAENPNLWKGLNLLGCCLMEVRDMLREG